MTEETIQISVNKYDDREIEIFEKNATKRVEYNFIINARNMTYESLTENDSWPTLLRTHFSNHFSNNDQKIPDELQNPTKFEFISKNS